MTLTFCVLGCLWVYKESYSERLSSRLLELEKAERSAKTRSGYLHRELLSCADYNRVQREARERLGMTAPQSPPDTIWCRGRQPEVQLGSLALASWGWDR